LAVSVANAAVLLAIDAAEIKKRSLETNNEQTKN
jgi:hypothetical protein